MTDLIRLYTDQSGHLILDVSPSILAFLAAAILAAVIWRYKNGELFRQTRFDLVRLNVQLGGVGTAEFRPSVQDIQIAHRIWTELVTRKAALPFDPENDVISEIYDSWYELFREVRRQIALIPGDLVRKEESTREIVRIATETLNNGLRPHLTKWQAKYRAWYRAHESDLDTVPPQEVQKQYPLYEQLVSELTQVNDELMQYANELQKIVLG